MAKKKHEKKLKMKSIWQRDIFTAIFIGSSSLPFDDPVSWGDNTLTASLQRGNTPPMSVLDMTLNNPMVRLQ